MDVTNKINDHVPEFLTGGGEMGKLIREYDWSSTPLGDPTTWDNSLKTCIRIILTSPQPMFVWWGSDLINIYNDPYAQFMSNKHPNGLGGKANEVWSEIWPDIFPKVESVFRNEGTYDDSLFLIMERKGYQEEMYVSFCYSPIPGDDGTVKGLFCACTETTNRIINERALVTLRDLGAVTFEEQSLLGIYKNVAAVLEKNNKDFPFAIIYSIDEKTNSASPVAWSGINEVQTHFPHHIDIVNPKQGTYNFCKAYQQNALVISENNGRRSNLPKGFWSKEPTHFVHIPLTRARQKHPYAIISAALNPFRQVDDSYMQFFQLINDRVSIEINKMLVLDEEQKRAEALIEIDKAKTTFFSNVSHEFRTPLTLILGSLEEMLKNQSRDASDRESVEITHRNALRLLRLVNNLLDFSRVSDGKIRVQYQLTDIAKFTTALATGFRSIIEKVGLVFHIRINAVIQPVYIDREMWEKIVLNLLSNAFKYTLKGHIEVSLTTENNLVLLKIADTGVGIPEDELPKMFQRFHRVQNVTGRSYEGTGIGLSLIKELVTLHSGDISVTSKMGKGTVFTVAIPTGKLHLPKESIVEKEVDFNAFISDAFLVEATSFINQPTNLEVNPQVAEDAPTIMVVDDNADMRVYIQTLLQNHYHVVTANNGMDALHKIQKQKPSLILSDIMMPVMDGIQLVKEIKKNPSTVLLPTILLSARAGEEAVIEGYDTGADDYLSKPFSAKELLARVRSQIDLAEKRNVIVKQLEESENYFRSLTDTVPTIIWITNPEGYCTYLNQYWYAYTGQTKEVAEGFGWLDATHPDDKENSGEIFLKANSERKPFTILYRLLSKNGEYRWCVDSGSPKYGSDGAYEGMVGTVVDIHEQKLAEEELQKKTTHLQIATTSAEVGTWSLYLPNGTLEWSDLHKKLWGYDSNRTDLVYEDWHSVILPGDKEAAFAQVELARVNRSQYENMYRIKRANDGVIRYMRSVGQYFYDEHGSAYMLSGISMDITEQKEAEEALLYRKALLEAQNEAVPDAILVVDTKGNMLSFNRHFATLWNIPKEIIDTKDDAAALQFAMTQVEDPQHFIDRVNYCYAHPEENTYEEVLFKDGRIIERYGNSIKGENGTHYGFIWFFRDISQRKKAEIELKKSRSQFIAMADNIPNLAWMAKADGYIYWYNKKWYDYTGTTSEQMEGWGWQSVHDKNELPHVMARWQASIATGNPFEMVFPLKGADGKFRQFLTRVLPVKNEDGQIQEWFGTNTDVTEQVEAAKKINAFAVELERKVEERTKELKQSEEKFNNLFQFAPLGLSLASIPESKFVNVNENYAKLFGYTLSELDGKSNLELGIIDAETRQRLIGILTENGNLENIEMLLTAKSGAKIPVLSSSRIVSIGEQKYFLSSIIDITERKTAEIAMAKKNSDLEKMNKELQSFAYISSHDLQEPLRKIQTFADRIIENADNKLTEQGKEQFTRMQVAANRMQSLIADLLTYSRTNTEERKFEVKNLNQILDQLKDDLKEEIEYKKANIISNDLGEAKIIPFQFLQLLQNLVSNSLKFAKHGIPPKIVIERSLKIFTQKDKANLLPHINYLCLTISDNGIGFEPEYKEKIFEVFQRLHGAQNYKGTGIGLAIVKKIVENHLGFIDASGETGKGATFEIYIPSQTHLDLIL